MVPAAATAEITGSVCLAAALLGEAACFNLTYLRRDRRTDERTDGRADPRTDPPLPEISASPAAAEEEEEAAA